MGDAIHWSFRLILFLVTEPASVVCKVIDSRRTLYRLMQLIDHRDEGEPVFIEIE